MSRGRCELKQDETQSTRNKQGITGMTLCYQYNLQACHWKVIVCMRCVNYTSVVFVCVLHGSLTLTWTT